MSRSYLFEESRVYSLSDLFGVDLLGSTAWRDLEREALLAVIGIA
jgi:hypothetical protein